VKVWVAGASGLLGHAFRRVLERREIPGVWSGREVDITDAGAVLAFAAREQPTHVINCAGYTRVDDAESDEAAAFAVNATGAGNVARAALEAGALLVHVSTDYVFDGAGQSPYREEDACSPVGSYGRTKREGERRVLEVFGGAGPAETASTGPDATAPAPGGEEAGRVFIVRTSWLFGEGGDNFVTTMLRLMREREVIEVVADQRGRPTYTRDFAKAALVLTGVIGRTRHGSPAEPQSAAPGGLYHFANANDTTWHGFASEIQRQAVGLGLTPSVRAIAPIGTAASGRRAPRPANSVLATDRIEVALGETPRPWQAALADYLEGMIDDRPAS
jgi:dTDP-4-dehydrorhamnose reductase